MKPSWSDAPKTAQWLALDKTYLGNKRWFWYSAEPTWNDDVGMWIPKPQSICAIAGLGTGDPQKSLEARP